MLNKILFVLIMALPALKASAIVSSDWSEKGNGGDVITCLDPSQNKMYDAYETQVRHQLHIVFPPSLIDDSPANENYSGFEDLPEALRIAGIIVDRAHQQDPSLHKKLQSLLSLFFKRVRFIANTNLIDVEDMGIAFLPNNCSLQQLVIQRPPRFPADRLYTVALDHWKTLSIQQKAVAIVHEVLYTTALVAHPVNSSEEVRYFNALLLSDTLKNLNKNEYQELYESVFGTAMPWTDSE